MLNFINENYSKVIIFVLQIEVFVSLIFVDYSTSVLFTIYGDSGEEQLILSLERDIKFFYNPNPDDRNEPISFGVDISDGQWHRLGVSIKGDAVTIILDCNRHITKKLRRNFEKTIAGILMIGQQLKGDLYLVSEEFKMIIYRIKNIKQVDKEFVQFLS